MDVINPTEWLWFGTEHMNLFTGTNNVIPDEANPSSFVGVDQEFKNIVKYGPLSGKGSSVEVFRNLNSWYYGFWSQGSSGPDNDIYFRTSPWNFNNKASLPATEYPYPRIFNSRIDRSDYCRFHKVPSIYINGEEYIRYVMYSPEKNIDDADSKGDLTSRPKVQHIEVRFADMNGTTSNITNYDDNDCYWIYFTDYAENNGKIRSYYRDGSDRGNGRYTYDDAEQYDPDFLKLLQPVVRNCHYVFTINSINDEHIGVNLGVCGAAGRSTSFTIN